jgi:hypothetical protein
LVAGPNRHEELDGISFPVCNVRFFAFSLVFPVILFYEGRLLRNDPRSA